MKNISEAKRDDNTDAEQPTSPAQPATGQFNGEKLTHGLQENLMTILAYREQGGLLADTIRPELFEGDARLIVEQCVQYWSKYNKPPGMHTADLFDKILSDQYDRRAPGYSSHAARDA